MLTGKTYVIQTGDLADGADTIIQLYAPDCVVMLAENDDYGSDLWSRIEWAATISGTYAVRVVNCDPTVAGAEVTFSVSVQELPLQAFVRDSLHPCRSDGGCLVQHSYRRHGAIISIYILYRLS